ncbi:MAG: TorF family putative porin [candidate division Zixibacteria bacterium]|nr:TorF family putative porin [candidate division Zixibacteria bacterium]
MTEPRTSVKFGHMLRTKRIKRKIIDKILIGFLLFFFASPAVSEIQMSSTLTLVSRYIFRGSDIVRNDRPAVQPSLTLNLGESGLWFNVWSAIALVDTDFVELDFIAGYDRVLSRDLTLSTGIGLFTFPSYPNYPDKNSTSPEIYLGTTFSSIPLSPRLTAYYDFNLGDGFYLTLDLKKNFTLGGRILSPTFLLAYTSQNKNFGVDSGFSDICFGVSTDFVLKKLTLTPSLNYVIVPNETINEEDEIWAGLSMNYGF